MKKRFTVDVDYNDELNGDNRSKLEGSNALIIIRRQFASSNGMLLDPQTALAHELGHVISRALGLPAALAGDPIHSNNNPNHADAFLPGS